MKAFMGLLFLMLVAPSLAQAPSPNSIVIGDFGTSVRLTLGKPKEAALSSLRESYGVIEGKTGNFGIVGKNNEKLYYGSVSFREGRLFSVTKHREITGPDHGVAVARAIYGAMSSFGESTLPCHVTTFDNQYDPTLEKRGVEVSCGWKRVEIFTNRWASDTGSHEAVIVNEVLSSEP
jgi:hypothetical protein